MVRSPEEALGRGRNRPARDPREHGFRRAWVSNALLWSRAARGLLHADQFAEAQLSFVALYLSLKYTALLLEGTAAMPGDKLARADCPLNARNLRKFRNRVEKFRDEILHLSDKFEEGREVSVHFTAHPMELTLVSTVGRRSMTTDSMTRSEIEATLDRLEPWLSGHFDRLTKG